MAAAEWAAGARREPPRPQAARSVADRRHDLSARPAALRQPGISGTARLRQPECAGAGGRTGCALCRGRRLFGEQHIGSRHAGDDLGWSGWIGTLDADRSAAVHDFMGRRARACLDVRTVTGGGKRVRGDPDSRSPAGPRTGAGCRRPTAGRGIRQCRGSRRHSRHHRRGHRDVRCGGRHPCVQSQCRGAVRL